MHTQFGVRYDELQDLNDFEERSSHVNDDEYLARKFMEHSLTLYSKLSKDFQPDSFIDKFINKYFPTKLASTWNKHREVYPTKRQIQRILYTIEFEQHRETMLSLMYGLFGKTYK